MNHLISMKDLSKEEILFLIDLAGRIEGKEIQPNMVTKIAALLFYEPSTRTQLSFAAAMKRLGGDTITLRDMSTTSVKKGESFADTMKTISLYSDIIVIRSPKEGAARRVSEIVNVPVINAGDGANQHPTQALLDLYAINKTQGTLNNLNIGIVGDLRFGRTVHSLIQAMSMFENPNFTLISPDFLKTPTHILDELQKKQINFTELTEIQGIENFDILYVTRIQKERFAGLEDFKKFEGLYEIRLDTIKNVKKNFKILHPMPRVKEIHREVDKSPHAFYFQQAKGGVFMRQAIISHLLGGV